MKVFAIAKEYNECYGHGIFINELKISQKDPYSNDFSWHPLFLSMKDANEYILENNIIELIVVELDVL